MKKEEIFRNPDVPLKKRVADLVSRLSLEEKINLLATHQQPIERLGIGEWFVGTEIARGYVGRKKEDSDTVEISTVFPQPIGLASTFDPGLMYKLGEIAGTEARIYYQKCRNSKLTVWGPTVDLCRDPRWGRNEEGYGEDPFLTGEMTTSYTKGMRGGDKNVLRVLPALKHFCANNHEEDRARDSANVEPRTLREYYYAAFEAAIKAKGAYSFMTAYNELSGVPGMINPDIKDVCKKEWGLLFAVTDGGDFTQNVCSHHFGYSHAQTIAYALKAGNDVMCDNYETVAEAAREALKLGLMSEKDVDRAVTASLTGRFMLGEFNDDESNPYAAIPEEKLNCKAFKATNARAARECITLLKNDSLLPLKDSGKLKIAVIGPHADSYYSDWYTGLTDYSISVYTGLCDLLGKNRVTCYDGYNVVAIKSLLNDKYLEVKEDGSVTTTSDKINQATLFIKMDWGGEVVYKSLINGKLLRLSDEGYLTASGESTYEWFVRSIIRPENYCGDIVYKSWRKKDFAVDIDHRLVETDSNAVTWSKRFAEEITVDGVKEAVRLAKKADVVIVCLGNDPLVIARECYDRKTLALPPEQQCLLDEISAVNKNTVLLIVSSYPYSINREARDLPAIMYTAHGGPEYGKAIADALFGKYNPAGRTPQTWYKSERDLPDIKDYDIMKSGSTYLYFEGEPLYPFGHGLSYSSFAYSDFSVEDKGRTIEARVKVKNTSERTGEEVVQLYFTALNPRVKRPKLQLCEFLRQEIEAGLTAEIVFNFDKERLRFWDVTRDKFAVEEGEYRFAAGSSSGDLRCKAELFVKAEKIPPRNMSRTTRAVDYDDKQQVMMMYDIERGHYIKSTGWNGELYFYDVKLDGATGIDVKAAIDAGKGKIGVYAGDETEPVAEIEIPVCACPTDFKKRKARFDKALAGNDKLTLKMSTGINLLDIKLRND